MNNEHDHVAPNAGPPPANPPPNRSVTHIVVAIRRRAEDLAMEAYARFQVGYEADTGVRLAPWASLDRAAQERWRDMFAPVAGQLLKAEENTEALRILEANHRELRARADRDAARAAELEDLLASISQRLPDAALLGNLPASLLEALAPLSRLGAPELVKAGPLKAADNKGPAQLGVEVATALVGLATDEQATGAGMIGAVGGLGPEVGAGSMTQVEGATVEAADAETRPVPKADSASPVGDERQQAWGRVEARLATAGLIDLDAFTTAQIGQVGNIVAEVLGLDLNQAAQQALGSAGAAVTRAFVSVRAATG